MQRTCPRTAGSFYLNLRASARVAHEDLGDDAPSPERTPDQGVEVRLPKFGRNFILDRRRFLPEGDCADQCHAVDSGLILKADSEAELAGVMAHEIAHVAARHGTRQATRAQVAQLATIPLIFMGGWAGYGIRQAASVMIPIGFLQFSQANEREADMLGLQYMYKTGYDPEAFIDFFEKIESLEKKKPGTISKVFATHPPTQDRIVTAQKNIQEMLKERPEYVVTTSEFNDVKARLAMMHNKRTVDQKDSNRPQLRRAPGAGTTSTDGGNTSSGSGDDDRPTLKRAPGSNQE